LAKKVIIIATGHKKNSIISADFLKAASNALLSLLAFNFEKVGNTAVITEPEIMVPAIFPKVPA
jgi:hypothetical protein